MFGLFRNSTLSKSRTGTRRPPKRERGLRLEPLEDRLALSASWYLVNNGVLTLYGDLNNTITDDTFTIGESGQQQVTVTLNNYYSAVFGTGDIQSVIVNTGPGNNSVYITSNSYAAITVNSGGNDLVSLGNAGSCLGLTSITLTNPSHRTNLQIWDNADTTARTAYVYNNSIDNLWHGTLYFDNLSYLSIFGGSGGNTFNVLDTPATADPNGGNGYTYISSGAGDDTVNITGTTGALYVNGVGGFDVVRIGLYGTQAEGQGGLDRVNGAVNVSNRTRFGGGNTALVVDGSLGSGSAATLDDGSLTGLTPGAITWSTAGTSGGVYRGGVIEMRIWASYDLVNTFTVQNTSPFGGEEETVLECVSRGPKTINVLGTTGPLRIVDGQQQSSLPPNVVNIGIATPGVGNGTLANINGAVVFSYAQQPRPTMTVNIDDSGDTEPRTALFENNTYGAVITGLSPAPFVLFAYPQMLNIFGSGGGTAFDFTDFNMNLPVTLVGMSDGDVIKGPAGEFYGFNTWTVSGQGSGQMTVGGLTNVSFRRIDALVAAAIHSNANVFRILQGGGLSGGIYGGPSPGVIDYSAWTTGVTINLATGAATGIGGGVHDINNAIGGAAADSITGGVAGGFLVGRGGNDGIVGGSGRNIIIGSGGADTLVGGALSDLIISDRTNFSDYASLFSITKEWLRTDKDYTGRMYDLRYGGGYNGSAVLLWGSSVLDDGSADQLVGQAGRDWFFANIYAGVLDVIRDLNNGGAEQVD